MFKDKKVLIVVGVVVLALLLGGYFLFGNKSKMQKQETSSEEVIQKISADELGLTLTAKPDKKAVKFMLGKADGVKSVEYQLTYEADSTAQEKSEGGEARVQRGITGQVSLEGKSSYESPWLDLGSCSKNVCRYDTGVSSVTLTLKIVKTDGKVYEAEKTLEL